MIKIPRIEFLIKLKNTKRNIFFVLFVFLAVITLFFLYPRQPVISKTVVITSGMSARDIAHLLKKHELITNETFFLILTKIRGAQDALQAGEYLFNRKMGANSILNKIIKGEIEYIKLTIPEGYTYRQIAELIEEKKLGNKENFLKEVEDKELQGYLFPETYLVHSQTDEKQIIQMMNEKFNKVFDTELKKRAKEIRLTEKEVVILASMIEKEAKDDEERSLVSSVFHNRLKRGWLLESCATVQYALGRHKPKLTYDDLKVNSPYNTYIHPGLPPGPICNPGEASIRAALYPQDSDALFFVTGEDGTHRFSKYYKEHLRKKRKKSRKTLQ